MSAEIQQPGRRGADTAPDVDAWFTPWRLAGLIGFLILAAYPEVVLGVHSLVYRDFGLFTCPVASYHRAAFWRGEMALWNPLNDCGVPFLAQWNTTVLYPFSLIYVLFPLPWSLNFFCLGHLLLAGLAMYFLALRWTGSRLGASAAGVAFAWNGLSVHCLMWTSNLAALAWMPMVVLLVEQAWQAGGKRGVAHLGADTETVGMEPRFPVPSPHDEGVGRGLGRGVTQSRIGHFGDSPLPARASQGEGEDGHPVAESRCGRRWLLAALVAAIQMLTGSPEIILLTWLVLGALAFTQGWRKQVAWGTLLCRLAAIVVLVAALTAAQILPFLDLMAHSDRNGSFDTSAWAMPAWGWANFVVPLFHCSPSILGVFSQDEQQWTSSYYIGIGALALALLAVWRFRRSRVGLLAVIAAAGVLLAMGGNEPLYRAVSRLIPIFGFMRYPIKLVVLTIFAVPLLAGYAIAGWQRLRPQEMAGAGRRLAGVGIFLLIVLAGILFAAHRQLHAGESWPVTLASGASRAVFLLFILGGVFWWGRAQTPRAQRLAGLVILFCLGLDGLTHTPKQNPTVNTNVYGPVGVSQLVTVRLGEARAMESPHAYAYFEHAATPNVLDYYLGQRRTLHMDCNLLDGIPVVGGFFSVYPKETAAVQALFYGLTNAFPEPLADFVGAAQISSPTAMFEWVNRTNAMPLLTAGQRPEFASTDATLQALDSPEFNPRTTVFLPPEAAGVVTATNPCAAQVEVRRFSAQKIDADVTASQPAMLIVAQTYYHCWHAYVDGQRVRLWRANHAFQALEVPAGHHTVQLIYEDRAFKIGACISLAALAYCAVVGLLYRPPLGRSEIR